MVEFKGGLMWGKSIFGMMCVSYPFGRIIISSNSIVFKSPFTEFELKKVDITGVTIKCALVSKGISFKHHNPKIPKMIVFWSFKCDEIMMEIGQLKSIE
jgi:hypothetical protein